MPLSNSVASATITLQKITEISLYNAELLSTNGNVFHPYDLNTTLIFKVYNNSEDITDKFTDIAWTRTSYNKNEILEDSGWGNRYDGLKSINIDKDDFQEKCIIQADAYAILNGKRTCVASARITLLDVNELYSSVTPPEDPIDGQLWVDTGGDAPTIYSWNKALKKWIVVGETTPTVRNLINNSNFWMLNSDCYLVENDSCLLNTTVNSAFEKKWLRLKSNKATNNENATAGIFQETTFPITRKSDYTFSLLAYCINDIEYTGNHLYVKVFSVDITKKSTELITNQSLLSNEEYDRFDYTFKTLSDTEYIRVFIGVEPMKMCEFYITELSLYNTNKVYPWELSPEDLKKQMDNKLDGDHLSVFNALTKNGTMQGIYIDVDKNGEEHYFFNGTHIKAGSIDGGLINGIGLNIKDDETGQSIFHVYKDEDGTHIDLIAQNLYIGSEPASTKGYAEAIGLLAESNAAGYTDNTVAINRAESEKLLNENIDTSAQAVTDNMTLYVDSQIEAILESSNDYIDSSVSGSTNGLINLINNNAVITERNAKNYTDTQIANAMQDVDLLFDGIDDKIKTAEDSALAAAKTYADNMDASVRSDLNLHSISMTTYFSDQTKVLTGTINTKADKSVVDSLSTKVATLETNTKISTIISAVRASTEYKADLNAKLDVTTFNTKIASIEDKIASLSGSSGSSGSTDTSSSVGTVDAPKESIYSKTFYSNNYISFTSGKSETLTLDTLLDAIDITSSGTTLTLDVSKLDGTKYIAVTSDKSKAYLDLHEIVKFLIYKVKQLESKIK